MSSKGGAIGSWFEPYTRYSGVDDEKKKKKLLGLVLKGSFLSNLDREGNSFFNFFKGGLFEKKKFGKPWF